MDEPRGYLEKGLMERYLVVEHIRKALRFSDSQSVWELPEAIAQVMEERNFAQREYEDLKNELGEKQVQDGIKVLTGYESLADVLTGALMQAAIGKGRDRHADDGEPFEQQKICEIARRVGLGYPLGQAIKKATESQRLGDRGPAELLGAINYLAAAYLVMEEGLS